MRNEEREMRKDIKCCVDCLHCKVSAKSTEEMRLCFCSESKSKGLYKEFYWLHKTVCSKFDYMGMVLRSAMKEKV